MSFDPSSISGIQSLLTDIEGIDLNELEREVSKPPDFSNSLNRDLNRVEARMSSRTVEQIKYPPRNVNDFFTPKEKTNSTSRQDVPQFRTISSSPVGSLRASTPPTSFDKPSSRPQQSNTFRPASPRTSFRPSSPPRTSFRASSPRAVSPTPTIFNNSTAFDDTNEQKKNHIISSVISSMNNNKDFDLRKEAENEDKSFLLEEIDTLIEILTEEAIDVSRIKLPDMNSSLAEIAAVRECLARKNDRVRGSTLATEGFLAISRLGEAIFDGKTSVFGYNVDMTGFTDVLGIKMRRMRFDTSSIVNSAMRKNNVGPGTRILMEIVPAFILFTGAKRKCHNDNLYTSSDMSNAINRVRGENTR